MVWGGGLRCLDEDELLSSSFEDDELDVTLDSDELLEDDELLSLLLVRFLAFSFSSLFLSCLGRNLILYSSLWSHMTKLSR